MQRYLLPLLITACFRIYASNEPAQIEVKTRIIRSHEWYVEQASLWRQQLNKNASEDVWMNYYIASRYSQAGADALAAIEKEIEETIPNSFTDNLVRSWNHGYSPESFEWLNKALKLRPSDVIANALMVLHHEYNLNSAERGRSIETLWRNGGISVSLLNYSYNVLMSVEPDAVLFTEGENTTLPIFLLQDIFNVRKDVQVLNLELLLEPSYRKRKLEQSGLKLERYSTNTTEIENKRTLCELLPGSNPSSKFYYSLTLGQQNISSIKDQLYVVGLASQISSERIDNISLLRGNLENRFLLDNLAVDFNGESEFASGKVLSSNYLVPMLLLSEHYMHTGETEKLKRWESLINKIATEKGKTLLVQNFLNREIKTAAPFISANLNPKAIEGQMKQVKGNIYAYEHEITNAEYNSFLKYLKTNKQEELLERSKIDLSQYTDPALTFMKTYHADPVVTKKKKYFTVYPVVNISYEGAVAYCEWLTEQYNNLPERKFKKVRVRLPSVNEWQIAALGYRKFQSWTLEENNIEMSVPKNDKDELCKGCPTKLVAFKDSDILYPWYGSYNYRNKVLNSRGCALGNFKWPDDMKPCIPTMPTVDGWTMMAPVQAYFPNDIGLYDVVGNVAEMTVEKGKACGGSWNHPPEESTIRSINEYAGPDSRIGFRPFMEVIEE
jgi:formylglycine-generating enzyme required for sulfatase activity